MAGRLTKSDLRDSKMHDVVEIPSTSDAAVDRMLCGLSMITSEHTLTETEAKYLRDLAGLIGRACKWCELGVWCGRSLWAAACGAWPDSRLYGIDTFEGRTARSQTDQTIIQCAPDGLFQWDLAYAVQNLINRQTDCCCTLIAGRSASPLKQIGDQTLDVLIVDADHRYESVRADLTAWLPKLRPGGLILGHDYTDHHPGVIRAFQERFGSNCETVDGTRYVQVYV